MDNQERCSTAAIKAGTEGSAMNAVIRWCLGNRLLVLILSAALFAAGLSGFQHTPVDAIPDIGEKQVIVFADWPGRSPQDVEDQVTYPLTVSMQGTPGVKTIRSMSGFGFSMVFVIFKDDTDYYWARSRVIERLSVAQSRVPPGVTPALGPDATALGQIYWYTLEADGADLAQLRSVQDWYVRYQLNSVEGVSEVASIGGHVKQYQIDVHPDKLRAHRVTLPEVYEAVARSNIDVGAKTVEKAGMEFFIRGVGFVKGAADLENIVIRQEAGTPILVRNVATVQLGPDFRRGALDKHGQEAVGGVVLMRYGENPLAVIERLKLRIAEIEPGLKIPLAGGMEVPVRIVPFYDRTDIVKETISTLSEALIEETLVAGAVVLLFLLHLRSSLAILPALPLSLALSFLAMYLLGIDGNIMSLAGLAIAIGDIADTGIIMTENIYRRVIEEPDRPYSEVVHEAATEVAGAIVTAVSNTLISFIPVFFLTGQEGKLFKPLAYTKTFAIGASVVLSVTLVPVLAYYLLKPSRWSRRRSAAWAALAGAVAALAARYAMEPLGFSATGAAAGWPTAVGIGLIVFALVYRVGREKLVSMDGNIVSRAVYGTYRPVLRWVLGHKAAFMSLPIAVVAAGLWIFSVTGREFMPPLDEGSVLFMPSLLPSASLTEVQKAVATQDKGIESVPEVKSVVGKLGRTESALDPAPVSMVETIIVLRPENEWRPVHADRWHSDIRRPDWLRSVLKDIWPEQRERTKEDILAELQAATDLPGVLPTWLQPIQTRIIMLQTGFRAMMGIKIFGSDLKEIERIGLQMERILKNVPGASDVVADRIIGKPYIEYEIDREAIARYGIRIRDVQDVIEVGVGGENLTVSVEGRERYPIRVRYPKELRDDPEDLERVLVPASTGAQIPIGQVARIRRVFGPQEIKSENGLLVGYVTMNTRDRDEVSVVEDAERLLRSEKEKSDRLIAEGRHAEATLAVPSGYHWQWGGQFENQQRATKRLSVLVPIVLLGMFVMLYLGFGKWWLAFLVFFSIVVSAAGGFIMLYLWGSNLSVAVWVGFIVLFGVADDDSVVMLTYLEQVFAGRRGDHAPQTPEQVRELVIEAGLKRVRPALMTMATTVIGLLPVFLSSGRGSDVMQPMAIPSVGGMAVHLITMFVTPCLYCAVMEWKLRATGE